MGPKIGRRRKYWYKNKQHLKEEETGSIEADVGSIQTDVGSIETHVGSIETDVHLVVSVPLQLLTSSEYIVTIPRSVYLSANAIDGSVLYLRLNQLQVS